MYQVKIIHDDPRSAIPVNKHTWVYEYETLTEAKNKIVDDITESGSVVSFCSITKI